MLRIPEVGLSTKMELSWCGNGKKTPHGCFISEVLKIQQFSLAEILVSEPLVLLVRSLFCNVGEVFSMGKWTMATEQFDL